MWRRMIFSAAIAAGLMAGAAPPAAAAPALAAQAKTAAPSFAYFVDRLSLFGNWKNHPKWGAIWQPDAGPNFRPYFFGYWQHTADAGWLWVSNEPYGDIVYHYGRWLFDPADGWLWLPRYVWASSWVVWRQGEGEVGWLPMPPGYADLDLGAGTGAAPRASDDTYGYRALYGGNFASHTYADLWTFAAAADFGRSDRRRYVTDESALHDFLRQSQDITSYQIDDDRIADHSLDHSVVPREASRDAAATAVGRSMRRGTMLTSVSDGRELFQREQSHARIDVAIARNALPEGAAARRALSTLPPHGATPLQPFYPGLRPIAPLSQPLRDIQRRARTVGTDPDSMSIRPHLAVPGASPPLSQPLRDIERMSQTIGTQ